MASHLVLIIKEPDPTPATIDPPGAISFLHPGYSRPHDVLFKLPKLDAVAASTTRGVHHGTARLACQVVAGNAFHGYLSCDRSGQERVKLGHDDLPTRDKYWFFANVSGPVAISTSTRPRDGLEPHGVSPGSEGPLNESVRHQGDDIRPVVPRFQDWQFPHHTFGSIKWHFCPDDTEPSDWPPTAADTNAESAVNIDAAALPLPSASLDSQLMPPPGTGRRSKAVQVRRCAISSASYGLQRGHFIQAAEYKWLPFYSSSFLP